MSSSELLQTSEHGEYVRLHVVRPQTTGPWYNLYEAIKQRDSYFPPTIPESPTTFMIDLSATYPTPSVLSRVYSSNRTENKVDGRRSFETCCYHE